MTKSIKNATMKNSFIIKQIHPRGKVNEKWTKNDQTRYHKTNIVAMFNQTVFILIFLPAIKIHGTGELTVGVNVENV